MNPYKLKEVYKYLTRAKKIQPDLPDVFPASQAPIPTVRKDVETMDAVNEFMLRNPRVEKAGGGMLVKPSDDGSRPGYRSDKAIKAAQQLGNQKKTLARFKKIGDAFISQDYNALKTQTRKARMAKGAKDAGGILNQFDTKLINDVVFGNDVKAQNALAKNLGTNRKYMMDTWKEALEVTKTGKSKSISQNQLKKIKMQANIFDEILNNKNATVKSMAKKFNITEKQAVKESSKLLNNVYMQNVAIGKKGAVNVDSRGYSLLKSWLPDDFKVTDNFLDNFSNIKGLKKVQSENIGTLIRDAFGKGQDPKKYAQALAGLQEYNNFVNSLPEGLKLDLDHPLSKAFLKGSDVSPNQLLNVTPISSNYNRGFKQSLSMAYDKALLADTKDIRKIKQIEKLAKDLGVNIGKGSNKKLDFGATSIAKKTQSGLAEELVKNLNEQNISSAKLDELKKTEEGKKLLKEVFPTGRKLEIPKVDEKIIKQVIASLGGGTCSVFSNTKADGGRIGLQSGTPNIDDCFKSGSAVINSGKVPVDKADDFAKLLKRTAGLGRNIMKFGIIPEAMYVAADSLVRVGMGDTFKEAGLRAGDYLLPGDQTKAAEMSKVSRIFGDETGELVGRTIDYKNQLAKIQGLEDTKLNLKNLSGGGEFDYIGDLSGDVKNIDNQLVQAKNDLNNKFKITEAEQLYAESKQDDAYDASSANSLFSTIKRKYRDSSDNLSDVETLAAPEKTQMQLNLDMLPAAPRDFMMATDDQIRNYVLRENVLSGEKLDPQIYIDEKEKLKKDFMTKGPDVYGKEQVYGTQGTFGGEPVDMTNYKPSNRFGSGSQQRSVLYPDGRGTLAGGGIAKLAGVSSGTAPVRGPNPQGLLSLKNRVRNY